MKDILIAAGVLGVVYLIYKRSGGLIPTLTPAPPVPMVPGIPAGSVTLGGAYYIPPFGTTVTNAGASSPAVLPTTISYPTDLPPPGGVSGGIASGAAAGGNPLGSALTPGVSQGTGTSANAWGIGFPSGPVLYSGGNPGGYY